MIKRFTISLLVALTLILAYAVPVLAIADPDSPSQVGASYMYEDLLEDGDAGLLIDYYIDYAVLPDETATEAYMAIFVDTDGITQIKSMAPYTFEGAVYTDKGYGRGLIWMYFTPAEVTAWGIDVANQALYEIWFSGNPTLTWAGDPPKTEVVGIGYWMPAGASASTLLTLRILYYAQTLETVWGEDMILETALGSRLTTAGEAYFMNVISDLRSMAPGVFSAAEYSPTLEDLDYETTFGAVVTDGTASVFGDPITLVEGSQSVDIDGGVPGTIIFTLERGTEGTVTDDVGTVNGSPVTITEGTNTLTATGLGAITVVVNLENTQTAITSTLTGTGFDMSDAAALFGISNATFSGLLWALVSVLVCYSAYQTLRTGRYTLIIFDICIIGGAVLGFIPVLIAVLLFIGFGVLTGYVLIFRHATF